MIHNTELHKFRNASIKSFTDMSHYFIRNSNSEELSTVVDICEIFQAFSADCECEFSLINSIKSKSRKQTSGTSLKLDEEN